MIKGVNQNIKQESHSVVNSSDDTEMLYENREITLKEIIINIKDWSKFIGSQWFIILLVSLLGGGAGFLYAYLKNPQYTAETTFVLEDEKTGGMGGYAGLAGQLGLDVGSGGGGVFEGESLLALMKSRSMVQNALLKSYNINGKTITLIEYYIEFNNFREIWLKKNPKMAEVHYLPGALAYRFSLQQNKIIHDIHKKIIDENLYVGKQDKKSSIITLRVITVNELFSKYFAEALLSEVSRFYIETRTKKTLNSLYVLQNQVDSVRKELNTSFKGAAVSNDATPNLNAAKQILRVTSQRKLVDVQTNQAILIELVKNQEVTKMSLRKETPLIQVIDRPILPLLQVRHSKFKYLILGSFLFGFTTILFLTSKRFLGNLLD
jgi:hypothetical protein